MELNYNGNALLILLTVTLSFHLLSSANAICVPRDSFASNAPAASPTPHISDVPQSSPAPPPTETVPTPPSPPKDDQPHSIGSGVFKWFAGKLDSSESHDSAEKPDESAEKSNGSAAKPDEPAEKSNGSAAKPDESAEKPEAETTTPPLGLGLGLKKICEVTSNPQLCASSISSHLKGPVEPVTALKTEIEASIKEIQGSIAKLKQMRSTASTSDDSTAECLSTCHENFSTAIDDLKAALESIGTHDISRMQSMLAGVMTDLTTCDDTFAELGMDSPVDGLTTKMSKYASNCLAISKLLM